MLSIVECGVQLIEDTVENMECGVKWSSKVECGPQ